MKETREVTINGKKVKVEIIYVGKNGVYKPVVYIKK